MNFLSPYLICLSLVPFSLKNASSQTVTTDPVGFVTVSIGGSGYTFIGLPLFTSIDFSAALSANQSGGTGVIQFDNTPLEADKYNAADIGGEMVPQYFVEFADNTSDPGTMIPILSNTASSITLNQDVSSFLSGGEFIKIRPLHTLDSVFPDGAPLNPGFAAAIADEVVIFDSSTQSALSYYYSNVLNRWLSATNVANGNRSILPNQSIYINRKASGSVDLVVLGSVKMGVTGIDVLQGYNLVPNPYPIAYALNLSDLYTGNSATGLQGGFAAAIADEVTIYDSSGNPTTYYYNSVIDGGSWVNAANEPSATVEIPAGGAILINRKTNPFVWVKPQPF